MHEDASRIRQGRTVRVLATLSNAIIGLLTRHGYPSLKQSVEMFRAKPLLALELISSRVT